MPTLKRDKFRERLLKNETPAERRAFNLLQNHRFVVEKQKIIHHTKHKKTYFIDLWLPTYNLGIEIDGGVHHARSTHDTERDLELMFFGSQVMIIRFTNEEIFYKKDYFMKAVYETILGRIKFLNCSEIGRNKLDHQDMLLENLGQWAQLYNLHTQPDGSAPPPIIIKDKYAFVDNEREDKWDVFVLD